MIVDRPLTPLWQAEEILRAVRGQCLHEQTWAATGVSIDSRTVKPGDLFIALQGPTQDGHAHVAAAFAAGAVAAIVHRTAPQVPPAAPLIEVEDTFDALQDLGLVGRARAQAKILAITGSVGKTSSKEQLRLMLSAAAPTYANENSLNNQWGVPLSLARLPPDVPYGVIEIGMNHPGEMAALARTVAPDISLITSVEAVHLEHFPNIEAIADAKAEIFQGMNPAGTTILNRDNLHYARLLAAARTQGIKNILSFGRHPKSDARLIKATPTPDGSLVEAMIMDQPVTFRLGAYGDHLVQNALGSLLAATLAGANIMASAEMLATFHAPKGRGARHVLFLEDGGTLTLIDESYNASPAAVRAAIAVLAATPKGFGSKRIMVLGDMKELGPSAPILHAGLAEDLAHAGIDSVFCCGPMMEYLYKALPLGMQGGYATDSVALAPLVTETVGAGDVVAVKGSKSMQMCHLVYALQLGTGREPLAHRRAS